MSEREVNIKITARNLSDPAFKSARENLGSLGVEASKVKTWSDVMSAGMGVAGKEASASGKMIAGMSQVGRAEMERLAASTKPVSQGFSLANSTATILKSTFGQFTAASLVSNVLLSITSRIGEFINTGAKLPAVEASFRRLASGVGADSREMMTVLRAATRGMVSDYDLMLSSNKAMLLGLPVSAKEMGELAKTATVLGRAMGQDATKSFDDLITALGRSSPLILDNLGLTVKVGEANEAYAAKLGKTADQLTEAEKKTAFYEAAMEAARRKTAELGEQTKTLGDISTTVWTGFGNAVSRHASTLNVELGRALSSWRGFVDFALGNRAALMRAGEDFGTLSKRTEDVVLATEAAIPPARTYAERLAATRDEVAGLTAAQRAEIIAAKQLGVSTDELTKTFGLSAPALAMVTEENKRATTAVDKATKAKEQATNKENEFWVAASKTSQELQWMWTRLQPMPAALDAMSASTQVLASRQHDLSLAMMAVPWTQFNQHVSATVPAIEKVKGALGSLVDGFKGGMKSIWEGMSGGNGFPGLMNGLGKSIVDGFGQILSGGLTSVINMGVQLAMKGLSKLGGAIKSLFGGISAAEKEGRQAAAEYQAHLASMLDAQQRIEAGNESWKMTVIAVRDAYLEAGRTEAEALAVVERLWKAEKAGGQAVVQVIAEIEAVMANKLKPATEDAIAGAEAFGGAFSIAARDAQYEFAILEGAAASLKTTLAKPVTIPVTISYRDWRPDLSGLTPEQLRAHNEKGLSEAEKAAAMTDDQASAAIEDFLSRNNNDKHRLVSALGFTADRLEALGYHAGGRIPRAHTGMYFGERLAGDEIPIIAQTGEYMLSRRHVGDLGGAAGVERLLAAARGQGSGDVMPTIIVKAELYVSRDGQGNLRLTERDRAQVQDWLYGGSLQVPARAISGGPR